MNVGPSVQNVKTPPAPPAPPREADPAEGAREARQREEAFERALEQELERKAPLPLPHTLPWLINQPGQPTEESLQVDAIVATNGEPTDHVRQLAALMASARRKPAADVQPEAPVEPVTKAPGPAIGEVAIVVEPGLPPVQPTAVEPHAPVALADFPQVVVGQVRQMKDKGQAVTQLDFEINPPHVGPVNLQVAVQNGAVNVQLVALTMQAKQALENQVGQIQQILQSHQLTPGQIKVVTGPAGRSGAGASGKGDQAPGFGLFHGGRRRNPADEERVAQA